MTKSGSTEEQIVSSVAAVVKPGIESINAEYIASMLEHELKLQGGIEVFDIHGGSEKAGTSSGIVLFSARINGERGDYVLRFAPYDNENRIFAEYDIKGQFYIQKALSEAGLRVPNVIGYETDRKYLPQPGFVMDRIEGEIADANAYVSGFFHDATDQQRLTMLDEIMQALGEVHVFDWQKSGLDAHCMKAPGDTPIERHLNWYWKTIEWAKIPCARRLGRLRQWLIDNQPSYHRDDWSLVHGDTNIANYVFKHDKLISIIDWEMSAISHPSFDIASMCTYNAYCRLSSPPDLVETIPSDDVLKARYEEITGIRLVDFDYFQKLAAFPGLVTIASMGRAMPEEHQAANARLAEPLWAMAEGDNV